MSDAVRLVEQLTREVQEDRAVKHADRVTERLTAELTPSIEGWLTRCAILYRRPKCLRDFIPDIPAATCIDPDYDFCLDAMVAMQRTGEIILRLQQTERAYNRLGIRGHADYVPLTHIVHLRAIEAEQATLIWMERVVALRARSELHG